MKFKIIASLFVLIVLIVLYVTFSSGSGNYQETTTETQ